MTSGNRTGSSSGRRSQALRHADNVRPIFHTSPSRKTYAGRPRNNRRACLPVQIRAGTRRPAPLNRSRGSNKLSWEHGKTRPVTSPPDALRSVPKKAERSGVGQPESSLSSAALQVPLPARRHYKSPYPQGGTTSPLTRKAALQVPPTRRCAPACTFIRTTELPDHVFQEKCARERRKRHPGMHKKCAGKKAGQSPQQNPCDKLPAPQESITVKKEDTRNRQPESEVFVPPETTPESLWRRISLHKRTTLAAQVIDSSLSHTTKSKIRPNT